MKFLQNIKNGFTLAEVLITLVIVGVIAAMTIPTLMNNTNKQEYVAGLKKAYSTMTQATQKIISEEGMPRGDIGGWATSKSAVYNLYKKHLSITKDCGLSTGCFPQEGVKYAFNYKNPQDGNKSARQIDGIFSTMALADGMQLSVMSTYSSCSGNSGQYGAGSDNMCAIFQIDTNGSKNPNTYGYDVFYLVLKEDGLFPAGTEVPIYCKTQGGQACAAKVLADNAINY